MTLESAITSAENLDGLTLFKVGNQWQASSRQGGSNAWRVCFDADPVAALMAAVGAAAEDTEVDLLG